MRYPPDHKQSSRARLVEAGAALAKQEGFGNTGLQALMAAADMTTGAFYSQFKSKPELLQAIIAHELSKTLDWFEGKSAAEIARSLNAYLSMQHAENPAQGCAIPALGAEVARADDATRLTFEQLILRVHAAIADATGDEQLPWVLISQAVGAIVLARAMSTRAVRQTLLATVRIESTRRLLQEACGQMR